MPHILIVEDETIIRSALRRLLERNHYQVSEAGSVQEAQERYSIPGFDLVISDLEMPGIGGFELARRIRANAVPGYKDVPLLMLTGHSEEENLREGRTHRIQGFIVKPPSAEPAAARA